MVAALELGTQLLHEAASNGSRFWVEAHTHNERYEYLKKKQRGRTFWAEKRPAFFPDLSKLENRQGERKSSKKKRFMFK